MIKVRTSKLGEGSVWRKEKTLIEWKKEEQEEKGGKGGKSQQTKYSELALFRANEPKERICLSRSASGPRPLLSDGGGEGLLSTFYCQSFLFATYSSLIKFRKPVSYYPPRGRMAHFENFH